MRAQRASTDLNRFTRSLFHALPSKYDTLAYLLSFGQDRRWRAAVVRHVASAAPKRVLDVACGPAGVTLAIARATTASIVGVDLTEEMLRLGRANVEQSAHETRIRLAMARAEQLPFDDATFDAISFSYLMRYVDDPAATIKEIARCLRPGGVIASLEFRRAGLAPAHAVWFAYTRVGLPLFRTRARRTSVVPGRAVPRTEHRQSLRSTSDLRARHSMASGRHQKNHCATDELWRRRRASRHQVGRRMSRADEPAVTRLRPAFYATGHGNGGIGDWISLLHLPYTAWHLSYVAIGAALARPLRYDRLELDAARVLSRPRRWRARASTSCAAIRCAPAFPTASCSSPPS